MSAQQCLRASKNLRFPRLRARRLHSRASRERWIRRHRQHIILRSAAATISLETTRRRRRCRSDPMATSRMHVAHQSQLSKFEPSRSRIPFFLYYYYFSVAVPHARADRIRRRFETRSVWRYLQQRVVSAGWRCGWFFGSNEKRYSESASKLLDAS